MEKIPKNDEYKIDEITNLIIKNPNKNSTQSTQIEKFIFLWKSNKNPFSKTEKEEWIIYSPEDQYSIENAYQDFLKNNEIKNFFLNKPLNKYTINFNKEVLMQYKLNEPNRKRPVKRQLIDNFLLYKSLITDEDKENLFFWNSKKDPFSKNQENIWTPYDLEDQIILLEEYSIFRSNKIYKICELISASDYYINFENLMQLSKKYFNKQRMISRQKPEETKTISRKDRFYFFVKNSNLSNYLTSMEMDEEIIENGQDFVAIIKENLQNESIFMNNLQFSIIYKIKIHIKIKAELNPFENDSNVKSNFIRSDFMLFIFSLKEEIKKLVPPEEQKNSINFYNEELKKAENSKNFFYILLKIFTAEGFLYKKVNEILQSSEKEKIENIKFLYSSLLASFDYFSKKEIPNILTNKDLYVYCGCSLLEEYKETRDGFFEITDYKNHRRILNHFLSTTRDKNNIINLLDLNDERKIECIWEIKIPKKLLKDQTKNFIFLDNKEINYFPLEEEVLLRSGSVLQLESIEILDSNGIIYPGKFLKRWELKEYNFFQYLKPIEYKGNDIPLEIDFSNFNISFNLENFKYLDKTLKEVKYIESLNLEGNHFGDISRSIAYLSDFLVNKNIKKLNLKKNKLGNDFEMFNILCYSLGNNNNIEYIDLEENNLGSDSSNIFQLANLINSNKNLKFLNLSKNEIYLFDNELEILNSAISKSNSLKEINLKHNNFINEKNKYREEFIKNLKNISEFKKIKIEYED